MPWREDTSLYAVLVSEIMLQQTQVSRVISKFSEFTKALPDFASLAVCETAPLLRLWSGLGYNNRALRLRDSAKIILENPEFLGSDPVALPRDKVAFFDSLPGIGPATASAIVTYSYNEPYPFIETNVRAVFIHHFFADRDDVYDKELLPLVIEVTDPHNPREWNWALMDYGSHLKSTIPNPSRKSKHHSIQRFSETITRRDLEATYCSNKLR